jgi:hypothetical protein
MSVDVTDVVSKAHRGEHRFSGDTYEADFDQVRLNRQLAAVLSVVKDGEWRTLRDIAEAIQEPEASISARLRDLRKRRFGRHTVERRRLGKGGTFAYRLVLEPPPTYVLREIKPASRIKPFRGDE